MFSLGFFFSPLTSPRMICELAFHSYNKLCGINYTQGGRCRGAMPPQASVDLAWPCCSSVTGWTIMIHGVWGKATLVVTGRGQGELRSLEPLQEHISSSLTEVPAPESTTRPIRCQPWTKPFAHGDRLKIQILAHDILCVAQNNENLS